MCIAETISRTGSSATGAKACGLKHKAAGPVQAEDDLSFRRFRLDDEDQHLVAGVQAGGALRLKAVHFVRGDDAL